MAHYRGLHQQPDTTCSPAAGHHLRMPAGTRLPNHSNRDPKNYHSTNRQVLHGYGGDQQGAMYNVTIYSLKPPDMSAPAHTPIAAYGCMTSAPVLGGQLYYRPHAADWYRDRQLARRAQGWKTISWYPREAGMSSTIVNSNSCELANVVNDCWHVPPGPKTLTYFWGSICQRFSNVERCFHVWNSDRLVNLDQTSTIRLFGGARRLCVIS